jgi:beta-galactosidase/beta-glucuronidase
MNLNGTWQFKFDPGKSGSEQGWQCGTVYDKEIRVPFCMESSLSGIGYKDFMPAVWYQRTFTLPEQWNAKRILLHIGACDFFTRVYLNGTLAGQHTGGYTPIDLDITDKLKAGENTVVIEAQDDVRSGVQPGGKQCPSFASHSCSYTRTTGIWQTVWLEAVPRTYIGDFKVQSDLDNGLLTVTIIPAGDPERGEVSISVLAEKKVLAATTAKIMHQPVTLQVKLPEVIAWQPGRPFLYDLELTLTSRHGRDSIASYTGLRKIHVEGRNLFFNNAPLFMRMVLDQGFYPDGIYTAPDEQALINDIQISQAVGFNGARLHQKIFEPRFLYWADKMGYLVWGEHANWGCDPGNASGLANFIQEWTQALDRDFNHPAIIGWCPLNEIGTPRWNTPLFYHLNKLADPSRLAIDTSGYIHYEDFESDLYDVHDYAMPDQLTKNLEPLATGEWVKAFKNYPHDTPYDGTRPYFNSEFGGIWWNPESKGNDWGYGDRPKSEAEFIERYRRTVQVMLDNPNLCGWCYTQLYDIEQECNGLYYYDRRPKFPPHRMAELQKINSAPARASGYNSSDR